MGDMYGGCIWIRVVAVKTHGGVEYGIVFKVEAGCDLP